MISSKLMKESFRNFEHNKKVDLIGLGNAIVDIIVNIEDEFLEINNLEKGSMNLINSDESQRLLENCKAVSYTHLTLPTIYSV